MNATVEFGEGSVGLSCSKQQMLRICGLFKRGIRALRQTNKSGGWRGRHPVTSWRRWLRCSFAVELKTRYIIYSIDKHKIKTTTHSIHQALKCLGYVSKSIWHAHESKETKWSDNCCFWNILWCNGNLMVGTDKISL